MSNEIELQKHEDKLAKKEASFNHMLQQLDDRLSDLKSEINRSEKMKTIKDGNYTRHGKMYNTMGECKMKDPMTRQWRNAILYMCHETGNAYVIELQDFKNKFEYSE